MSDRRLRELERRFRETGALEDEATWLGARVQAGQVSAERLQLASDLKYGPARLAQGRQPADYVDFKLWPRELFERWGNEVLVRVSLACARHVTRFTGSDHVEARLETALATVATWLRCPCPEHVIAAQEATVLCTLETNFTLGQPIFETIAAITLGQPDHPYEQRFGRRGYEAPYLVADMIGGAGVRRAVEREVVPWALGDRDPAGAGA